MNIAIYIFNSGANWDNRIVSFTVQIRSLLKITNDLIDLCYESHDCRSDMRDTLSDESIDFEQASDHLVELRDILEKLRKAAKTNSPHSLDIGPSLYVVNGLLLKCKNEISEMETVLKLESGRKRIRGSSSSFDPQAILTGLALSTTALRGVVEENLRCVRTLACGNPMLIVYTKAHC